LLPAHTALSTQFLRFRRLPSMIVIAEAPKTRGHGRQAFLKRALLAVLREVIAEVENRTPRTFAGFCGGRPERDRDESCACNRCNARYLSSLLFFNDTNPMPAG